MRFSDEWRAYAPGVALGAPSFSAFRAANLKACLLSKMNFAMLTVLAYSEDGSGRFDNRHAAMPIALADSVLP